jgi:hypothetical protein
MDINSIKFDQDDIDSFLSQITNKSSSDKGWKIKINGEFVKLNSGKSIWAKESFAKSALRNHIFGISRNLMKKYTGEEYGGYKEENKLWNNFVDFLQAKGILEFVELK